MRAQSSGRHAMCGRVQNRTYRGRRRLITSFTPGLIILDAIENSPNGVRHVSLVGITEHCRDTLIISVPTYLRLSRHFFQKAM